MSERRHGGAGVEERQAAEAEEARRRLDRLHEDGETHRTSHVGANLGIGWGRAAMGHGIGDAIIRLLCLAGALAFLAWLALQVFRDMP